MDLKRMFLTALFLICFFALCSCAPKSVPINFLIEDDGIMRVATYNIRSADYGMSVKQINKELTDLGIEVVGIQELDNKAKRSQRMDVLYEVCGYDLQYQEYGATMEYDGGHYGIGIASIYPMELVKKIELDSGDYEARILMICKLDVNGKTVYVANTHLTHNNTEIRQAQINFIAEELKAYSPIILFGDFNIDSFSEYEPFELNNVSNPENPISSFKTGGCIDNIFYSRDITLIEAKLNESESSDHNMIWADIIIQ